MADKNVNIRINYLTNTAEVQKLEQLLRSANAASNQFQASAQKAGANTASSFNAAGASIETLNAKLISLKDRITRSSDPKAIAQLSNQYKALKTQLDAVNKAAFETPKAIKATQSASQSLAGTLGQLYNAAKLAFTAGIIREVVTTTLEMAKLAGNVEGVERAFKRAFPNEINLMNRLREATHGTVTDFELMQRTLQATNLGVAVEQLPILFEFAAARAQQTGESVDYLVDSIVRGIGRKSILVLDNLGLSATRLKEQFNGASLASQSVADVTRGVAEIAKVELEKMGGYAETSATKVDQITVSWKELKIELSKKIESGGFIDFFNQSIAGLKAFVKGTRETQQEQARLLASQDAARILESNAFKQLGDNQQKKIDFIQQEMNSRVQLIGRYNDTIKALKEERAELSNKNPYDERLDSLNAQIRGYTDNKFVIQETILALKDYVKEFEKANEVEKESVGIIEDLQNKIEALGESIKEATTVEQIERFNRQLVALETQLKELQELGKTNINVNASLVFDIKQGQRVIDPKKLMDSSQLEADTLELGKELGDKLGEGIEKTEGISTGIQRAFMAAKEDLEMAAIDITANSLLAIQQLELESYDNRLANIRDFYDEQQLLAGDNERAKTELAIKEERETSRLRKQAAEKEKRARLFSILIDTAASIAKTAAQLGFPAAIPFIAIAAANGAAQFAIASRAQPRGFKDGVLNLNGPGTGTSDSIPSRLSKGESVMTAKEWQTSKNVLKEVRAKTLDDDVLRDLKVGRDGVQYVGMDDKRIISKLDELKNSMPDVEARGNLLYVTKKKSDNYMLWVRKSTMSK